MRISFKLSIVALLSAFAFLPCCTPGAAVAADDDALSDDEDGTTPKGKGKSKKKVDGGTSEDSEESEGEATAGGCVDDADPLDADALHETLKFVASPELGGRRPGEKGDLEMRAFAEKRFKCLGLEPGGDDGTYFHNFTDSDGIEVANTIGFIRGTDPVVGKEIIVLGAHQDHFGKPGSVVSRLGANDNASGTTMVLHLAQAVMQQKVKPKRTLAFILFNSEEKGCEGSHKFVDDGGTAKLPINDVVYDLNFDMVGTYKQYGNRIDAHGSMAGSPANALLKQILAKPGSINMTVGKKGLGEDDSDFWAFCEQAIPMVAFFTDDPPCYHKSCDTEEKIDYPNMAKTAEISLELALGLANGKTDLAAFRKNARMEQLGCEGGSEGE